MFVGCSFIAPVDILVVLDGEIEFPARPRLMYYKQMLHSLVDEFVIGADNTQVRWWGGKEF